MLEYFHMEEFSRNLDQKNLKVLPYKDNTSPKGFVTSEELLNSKNVVKVPKEVSTETDIEEYNVGSLEKPKMIKLSKTLSPYTKQKYIRL